MLEIKEQVQHIVDTLENPEHNYCRECQCDVEISSTSDGDCPDCGEELGTISGYDYLNDALDIEYVIGSDRQYLGARVLVCFGGPNVWVDTRHNRVDGHWWADSHNAAFVDNIGLDEALQELWECQ